MLRTYKIKLNPTKEQKQDLNLVMNYYRFVYNKSIDIYKNDFDIIRGVEIEYSSDNSYSIINQNEFLRNNKLVTVKTLLMATLDVHTFIFRNKKLLKKRNKGNEQYFNLGYISKKTFLPGETKLTLTSNLKDIEFIKNETYTNYLEKNLDNVKVIKVKRTITNQYYAYFYVKDYAETNRPKKFAPEFESISLDFSENDKIKLSNGEIFVCPENIIQMISN